ncbi:sensor histidine kinase [Occultella gossypii]|uniref:histidine kinase n=1 Tax=Occultella gossypii TaxID=2800820 RepID=A0ABS7S6I4_9MICO|nr:HAMP domain-containing sensor histidine kinase [Occultella gossypii]MBZ2195355.1 HAMP domain-containing histidine kinase [Occultella gossypii]
MIAVVVILGVLLVAACLYLVLVLRQIRSMTRQLDRRLMGRTRATVTIDLVNGDLEALATRVNDAMVAAETATARSHRDERQFRAMITDISHDLRTPLTAVRGYQQLLGRSELDPEQRARLEVAQRHAGELENLVERLYEYTYLLEAEPHLTAEEFDASALVGEALLAAVLPLEDAGLDVRFEPDGPVPVVTDREKVTRIVQNLIRNATQHGRGVLDVALAAERGSTAAGGAPGTATSGTWITITCANGIEPGAQIVPERLFERFYTADRSRSGRTTGLGLSIVHVLTRQLGGTASAAAADGRLTLTVRIPSGPTP